MVSMKDEKVIKEVTYSAIRVERRTIFSEFLERNVILDVYIPLLQAKQDDVSLLLINDGQDLVKMNFAGIIDPMISTGKIEPVMCVGIHCSADRIMEYGTICRSDYKGRGARAGLYCKFILDELMPFIRREFSISSFREKSFAGFSLGGLTALDIAWNHANEFLKVGVFSGSLWWRRKGYTDKHYDYAKDRIMHLQIEKGKVQPWLHFFFQTGLLDETADRNNNGIIDSVEDTMDFISHLKDLGYPDNQMEYLQLEDGRHDVPTWARALPTFLVWGWGKGRTIKV